MATQIIPGKISGSGIAPSFPLHVYDDAFGDLSLASAISAVNAAAGITVPTSLNGIPDDGNPSIRRLSKSAWDITVNYRQANVRAIAPVTGSTVRPRFSCVAERRDVRWAPEVAAYNSTGTVSPSPYNGLVNVEFNPGGIKQKIGAVIDPPAPNLFVELALPVGTVTPLWCRTAALLVGKVNSAALTSGTYPIGTIFLYSIQGQLGTKDEFLLELAWSYKANVTGETRGAITGIDYNGHDYVWEKPKCVANRANGALFGTPEIVVVNRVHPYADLSTLGIQPP